jgi:DNA-binding response OmpR family regulator
MARVRALLRRPRAQVAMARILRFGDLTIDVDGHEVRVGNDVITFAEFAELTNKPSVLEELKAQVD